MKMRTCSEIAIASRTHTGLVRNDNQDRLYVKCLDEQSLLMAVADGMGGGPAGGEAAAIMCDALTRMSGPIRDPEQALRDAVMTASNTILGLVRENPEREGMGTTATVTYLSNGEVQWVHVGDTRFYVFRRGGLIQVTVDQTMAQLLVEEGRITADQARTHPYNNLLDQCVGCPMCEPEAGSFSIHQGDILLHTTDGLHDALSKAEMEHILASHQDSVKEMANALIQAALDTGGKDNVTVLLAAV